MKNHSLFGGAATLVAALLLASCASNDAAEDLFGASSAEPSAEVTDTSVPARGDAASISAVRDVEAPESPLDYALFEAYMDLAEARYFAGDERAFEFFADRAIAVSAGEDVSPEVIDPNVLPYDEVEDLKDHRRRVMDAQALVLARAYNPDRVELLNKAARAQVMFDCQIRELRAGRPSHDTEACPSGLGTTLASLEEALDSGAGAVGEPVTFVLYFDEDSANLDIQALAVIAEAEAAARKLDGAKITVIPANVEKADDAYGKILSGMRARAVAERLQGGGLPVKLSKAIAAEDLGSVTLTAGGRDPEVRRRVEIKVEN